MARVADFQRHSSDACYPVDDEVERACFNDVKKVAWSALQNQTCSRFHLQKVTRFRDSRR